MRLVCTMMFAVIGGAVAFLLPTVQPGPTQVETVLSFVLVAGVFGFMIDLITACLIATMTRDHEHKPDPNANAARTVAESTKSTPDANDEGK